MNQLPEAAFEQLKNELKAGIESIISESKSSIEQQFDNLKVSLFQQVDNFCIHSLQGQRIFYESPPQSVRPVLSDTDNDAVPLNLSNKCDPKEEEDEDEEKPLDLCSFRLSEQGQTVRQNTASASHQAVQQSDPSKSPVARSTQSSVPSSHITVSQPWENTLPVSVQQIGTPVRPLKLLIN